MPATPAWPPKSAPRLFVGAPMTMGQPVTIEGNQAHYLAKVMRVGQGATIILCDDITGEWACIVTDVGKRQVTVEPVERLREREAVPDFWLCPALLKKDRFDLVLEKATELGVAEIHPVITRRCVADKLNGERARIIVTEAAEQCARTALPSLAEPIPLAKLLADWPAGRTLFFADEQGGSPAEDVFAGSTRAALLTGPEGGFDDAERAAIRALPQALPITLGPRVLRGETAAIAAAALWMGIAGDWSQARQD
jgi:16S rRNA (uracil1498-N3)-methyltransferase